MDGFLRNIRYKHTIVRDDPDPLNHHWLLEWEFTTPDGQRYGSSVTGTDLPLMQPGDPLLMEIVEAQMAQMVMVAWELAKKG